MVADSPRLVFEATADLGFGEQLVEVGVDGTPDDPDVYLISVYRDDKWWGPNEHDLDAFAPFTSKGYIHKRAVEMLREDTH